MFSRRAFLQAGTLGITAPFWLRGLRPVAQTTTRNTRIVAENQEAGTTDWLVRHFQGDIEAFAYPTSVSSGDHLDLYVDTSAPAFDVYVFRSGYYGGTGGRLMQTIRDVPGIRQPDPHHDYDTGLTSCANWLSAYRLQIPATWLSGVYIIKVVRPDTGGEYWSIFVLRDDASDADVLYQHGLFTYHAYNRYGGKSLYTFNSGECETVSGAARGVKVSLMRPYLDEDYHNLSSYLRVEYPLVRWLEAQGYDVTYCTNWDVDQAGRPGSDNTLLNHRMFLSAGHDEYWTQGIRDAVTEARDAGVHISFMGANIGYWRVRLEDDPWSGAPDSVVVTYKTTEAGREDPSGSPTGTWRDPTGINAPENALLGIQYIGDNDDFFFPLRVTSAYSGHRLYRHTDLQTMPPDSYANLGEGVVGWEWDAVVDNGLTPDTLEVIAATPVYGFQLRDHGNSDNGTSDFADIHTTLYTAASGALVFATGTIQWAWGLGARAAEVIDPDPYIQQMTYNVLAEMDVHPGSPRFDLVMDGDAGVVGMGQFHPLDTPAPVIENVTVTDINAGLTTSGRAVEVAWTTDSDCRAQLWLGERADGAIEPRGAIETPARSFTVTLDNLVPGTTYYYRIMATNAAGQIAATAEETFKTPQNFIVTAGASLLDGARSVRCATQRQPEIVVLGTAGVVGVGAVGLALLRRRITKT